MALVVQVGPTVQLSRSGICPRGAVAADPHVMPAMVRPVAATENLIMSAAVWRLRSGVSTVLPMSSSITMLRKPVVFV